MAYQEVTTTGYGTRVGNSFKAIGSGFLMFVLGTALLWWNEGRAVKTEKMLDEAGNNYVEMENPNKKDASLEGELICGTAMATTEDSLVDAQFGIGAKAISIRRNVEYYQWVEHSQTKREDKLGGKEVTTTTYTYTKEWVSSPIQSSDFHDPAYQNKNSVLTTIEDVDQWAETVKWGAYTLPEGLFHRISSREGIDLAISEDLLKQFDKSTQAAYERAHGLVNTTINKISQAVSQPSQPVQQPASVAIPDSIKALLPDSVRAKLDSIQAVTDSLKKQMANAENKKDLQYVHQASNVLYFGRVPGSPEVGDVRVTFEKVVPAKVTVMAVVDGDSFKPYKAKNGKRFQTLVMGKKSGDEIIEGEKEANNMILWALRILGIMIIIGGLKGIFGFLETILKVVPFIANIFGWGVGIVCTVVGIVWSLIVIALAWLFYRPVLAICLLAIAGFLIWVFAFKGKDKLKELASKGKNNQTQPAPQKAE